MKHHVKRGLCASSIVISVIAAASVGCSQGPSSSHDDEGAFDSTTGALVAHLKRIPDDVRCIEIQTSDWHQYRVLTDVEPGNEATIRIAPLAPGYIYFSGAAYSVPCGQIYSGDGGGSWGYQTWIADSANAYVQPGAATPITMTFRRLGGADISVDFDDGTPGCDAGPAWGPDGGPLCPPMPPWDDAGPTP